MLSREKLRLYMQHAAGMLSEIAWILALSIVAAVIAVVANVIWR